MSAFILDIDTRTNLPKAQTATLYLQKHSTAPEHSSTLHSNCLIEQKAWSSLQRDRGREEGGSLCEHGEGIRDVVPLRRVQREECMEVQSLLTKTEMKKQAE